MLRQVCSFWFRLAEVFEGVFFFTIQFVWILLVERAVVVFELLVFFFFTFVRLYVQLLFVYGYWFGESGRVFFVLVFRREQELGIRVCLNLGDKGCFCSLGFQSQFEVGQKGGGRVCYLFIWLYELVKGIFLGVYNFYLFFGRCFCMGYNLFKGYGYFVGEEEMIFVL